MEMRDKDFIKFIFAELPKTDFEGIEITITDAHITIEGKLTLLYSDEYDEGHPYTECCGYKEEETEKFYDNVIKYINEHKNPFRKVRCDFDSSDCEYHTFIIEYWWC